MFELLSAYEDAEELAEVDPPIHVAGELPEVHGAVALDHVLDGGHRLHVLLAILVTHLEELDPQDSARPELARVRPRAEVRDELAPGEPAKILRHPLLSLLPGRLRHLQLPVPLLFPLDHLRVSVLAARGGQIPASVAPEGVHQDAASPQLGELLRVHLTGVADQLLPLIRELRPEHELKLGDVQGDGHVQHAVELADVVVVVPVNLRRGQLVVRLVVPVAVGRQVVFLGDSHDLRVMAHAIRREDLLDRLGVVDDTDVADLVDQVFGLPRALLREADVLEANPGDVPVHLAGALLGQHALQLSLDMLRVGTVGLHRAQVLREPPVHLTRPAVQHLLHLLLVLLELRLPILRLEQRQEGVVLGTGDLRGAGVVDALNGGHDLRDRLAQQHLVHREGHVQAGHDVVLVAVVVADALGPTVVVALKVVDVEGHLLGQPELTLLLDRQHRVILRLSGEGDP
mmetsp:Transcript_3671/g.9879  ORF Transcript_3671/g.9879 Transcript_3671/m.9879 type:complete len:458 (-) Transcript_3671:3713-5086(-)